MSIHYGFENFVQCVYLIFLTAPTLLRSTPSFLRTFVLPNYSWISGLLVEPCQLARGNTPKENWFFLSQQLTIAIHSGSVDQSGSFCLTPRFMLRLGLARAYRVLCMLLQPLWVHMCRCPDVHRNFWVLVIPAGFVLFCFLFSHTASGSSILSTCSCTMIPEPWAE